MTNGPGVYSPVIVKERPGCLLQLLWFVFVGWWLGLFAVTFAYFMFALIITIPVGVLVLNALPELIALRAAPRLVTPYGAVQVRQHNILLRAIWFVLVGWWLTALVLALGLRALRDNHRHAVWFYAL